MPLPSDVLTDFSSSQEACSVSQSIVNKSIPQPPFPSLAADSTLSSSSNESLLNGLMEKYTSLSELPDAMDTADCMFATNLPNSEPKNHMTNCLNTEAESVQTAEASVFRELTAAFILGLGFGVLQLAHASLRDGVVAGVPRHFKIETASILCSDIPDSVIRTVMQTVANLLSFLHSYDGVVLYGPGSALNSHLANSG
jgi:hypothetical protein